MDSSESVKLINNSPTAAADDDYKNSTTTTTTTNPLSLLILQPFQWLKMLSQQLNPTFIVGVVLVYGLSQGFSGSFFRVSTDYYWKDIQKVQPSTVQLYMGFYYIPWVMKPIWGLLTDVFPVMGYRRRPYFVLAGVIGTVSALMVGFSGGKLSVVFALVCLVGVTAGIAIADVTIDACIARSSIELRWLAADIQSLCGFCSSVGALIGYSTSGLFVHHLGAQVALSLLAVPSTLLVVLGFTIYEHRTTTTTSLPSQQKRAIEKLGVAVSGMYKTIKYPQVWKPSLYMYLSLALSISTHEGQFYWFTDPKAGPAFSQEFIGVIYAIGALASIAGVLVYQKILKDYPFRKVLFFAQLFYSVSGMLDLVFILRLNLKFGIPDYFFVVMEECASRIISKIRWMPMIVLSTRLCPLGIEGTFFALLMCIDSLGSLSAKWGGGMVLHLFHVTRNDFTNLWLVILLRNLSRIATLALIFLVPSADQSDVLIPSDILTRNLDVDTDDDVGVQLVHLNEKIVV